MRSNASCVSHNQKALITGHGAPAARAQPPRPLMVVALREVAASIAVGTRWPMAIAVAPAVATQALPVSPLLR